MKPIRSSKVLKTLALAAGSKNQKSHSSVVLIVDQDHKRQRSFISTQSLRSSPLDANLISHPPIQSWVPIKSCYSTTTSTSHPNSKLGPHSISKPQKKLSPSFRAGPFRGALLNSSPSSTNTANETTHPDTPSTSTVKQHAYTPSQLRQALKPSTGPSKLHFPHSQSIKSHIEDLLYPLQFSEQLACRIVSSKNLVKSQASLDALNRDTEGGIGFAMVGEHNSKLSFMGRRVMHFALSNFLIHAPILQPLKNSSNRLSAEVIEEALLTKFVLGQYVGHQWELEKVMRWRELEEAGKAGEKRVQGTGLWTARGHVVEAILGAVMAHHGTRLSLAIFNSLVLPHLSFRLDSAFLPAIKAAQAHDRELSDPKAGLIDWDRLSVHEFEATQLAHDDDQKSRLKLAIG
ncbi:hypothetical protein O181_051731 [Austropuccinia psidii MF-1]|uniref:RNase III domain-containing protein n=1 Tax=Austropuccinia psidii MF-1 TaxID=1389203 RepID=A0A9Q3E4A2_9BASI|nr:hypothetical protein [Austropuccinia psidii MF-1]